jgi:hypothetical protein
MYIFYATSLLAPNSLCIVSISIFKGIVSEAGDMLDTLSTAPQNSIQSHSHSTLQLFLSSGALSIPLYINPKSISRIRPLKYVDFFATRHISAQELIHSYIQYWVCMPREKRIPKLFVEKMLFLVFPKNLKISKNVFILCINYLQTHPAKII